MLVQVEDARDVPAKRKAGGDHRASARAADQVEVIGQYEILPTVPLAQHTLHSAQQAEAHDAAEATAVQR
ncbi:MAG: hypothetical protein JO020_22530 [Chloroflexi bacterium]|nr:hypothetical protein [Chloroflexota bacterium]